MEAVVCYRTGTLPRALARLSPPAASPDESDKKDACVAVETNHPLPSVPPAWVSSGDFVRVRVSAASVNFADMLALMGQYQERPPLPFVLGAEVSGVVTEVGPTVTNVRVGDPVCAVVNVGAFAEQVMTQQARVFPLPQGCDASAAAALPVAFGTAHVALAHRANVQPGETVLVLGAAGGVGLAAVQISRLLGARVIAVARGSRKADFLRAAGADAVIDSAQGSNIRDAVKAQLQAWAEEGKPRSMAGAGAGGERAGRGAGKGAGLGVDVVFDPVGGEQLEQSLRVLAWGARIVIIGFASGRVPSIPANLALVKNLCVHGLYWGSYMAHDPAVIQQSMQQLLLWLTDGRLTLHVSHHFPFSQVLQAVECLKRRDVIGKVLLHPTNSFSSRL